MSATTVEDLELSLDPKILRILGHQRIDVVLSTEVFFPITQLATSEVAESDDCRHPLVVLVVMTLAEHLLVNANRRPM